MKITAKQVGDIKFIHAYTLEHGRPPSCDDYARHFGRNRSLYPQRVRILVANGLVNSPIGDERSRCHRAVRLTKLGLELIGAKP